MKSIKFIIIENEPQDYRSTKEDLLQIGFAASSIWPSSDSDLLKHWSQVGTTLTRLRDSGWNPKDCTIVLILDLALDANDEDFQRGVDAIRNGRAFYKDYATVVCTRAAPRVGADLARFVDEIFHKSQAGEFENRQAKFANAVRNAIRSVEKRHGRTNSLTLSSFAAIQHDLPFLAFVSAYGDDILLELIEEVSSQSPLVSLPSITVASGGYSGATVLLFQFQTQNGGSRQIAVKISRDQELLRNEESRLKEVHKAMHKFDDLPIPLVNGVSSLPGHSEIYFLQQHFANGRTLEAGLIESATANRTKRIIEALRVALDLLVSCGIKDSKPGVLTDAIKLSERMRLSYREMSKRVKAGCKVLDGNTSFKGRFGGLLPRLSDLDRIVNTWDDFIHTNASASLPFYEQHGDLNARNILLIGEGEGSVTIRLIDFARFGRWPIFYDVIRLRFHLALNLLDPSDGMWDMLPDRLVLWDKALLKHEAPEGIRKSHPKEYRNFCTFIEVMRMMDAVVERHGLHCGVQGRDLKRATELIALNELIRLVSYDGVSWTKRIWFTLVACRLVDGLESKVDRRTTRDQRV